MQSVVKLETFQSIKINHAIMVKSFSYFEAITNEIVFQLPVERWAKQSVLCEQNQSLNWKFCTSLQSFPS